MSSESFLFCSEKEPKKIKLYQYHSTISFASLTWTQVQTIFTGCDPFNQIPTGPTGKSGPPKRVDQFFRNFSGWTEPIHRVLEWNFWKFWLNGSRPQWPLSYKTLRWSDQIYYFLCEQEKWWKSQCNDCLILNGLIAEDITRSQHEKFTLS